MANINAKEFIKKPTTAEHYAYNACIQYALPFKVQAAIEHLLEQLLQQHAVPYHISIRLVEGILYQQKQATRVRLQEEK